MLPAELDRIFGEQTVFTPTGEPRALSSAIAPTFARALHDVVLARRPAKVLEIGMAHGVSSLAVLGALEETGAGSLISVDPHQSTHWEGIGVEATRRAGLSSRHTLIEAPDFVVLPRLLDQGEGFDLVYIDGWHTFDYTLLDLFFADKLLPVGAVVAVNDSGFASVARALRWFASHRRYRELDVGLERQVGPADHAHRRRWEQVVTRGVRLVGRLSPRVARRAGLRSHLYAHFEDRYFEKVEDWEPNWDFHAPF